MARGVVGHAGGLVADLHHVVQEDLLVLVRGQAVFVDQFEFEAAVAIFAHVVVLAVVLDDGVDLDESQSR